MSVKRPKSARCLHRQRFAHVPLGVQRLHRARCADSCGGSAGIVGAFGCGVGGGVSGCFGGSLRIVKGSLKKGFYRFQAALNRVRSKAATPYAMRATLACASGLAVPFIWWSYSAAISLLWISPDTWSNDRTVLACANTLLNKTAPKKVF